MKKEMDAYFRLSGNEEVSAPIEKTNALNEEVSALIEKTNALNEEVSALIEKAINLKCHCIHTQYILAK